MVKIDLSWLDHPKQFTAGEFQSEEQATAELLRVLNQRRDLWSVHVQVSGESCHPRLWTKKKTTRLVIDVLVIPSPSLKSMGWDAGVFGIECKTSGKPLGQVIPQAMDYTRTAFKIRETGVSVMPEWVFLFPCSQILGDIAAVCASQRIGTAGFSHGALKFRCASLNGIVIRGSEVKVSSPKAGGKEGSR